VESEPKYSIIIPSKNGMPYLKYAVRSVLSNDFSNLELLVSLDDTGDGSKDFLLEISDPRLRVIVPEAKLSMSEHWDFAQSHACGQWQMFLGQDDMLMSGFSDSFEYLTDFASKSNLGLVVARRAYVCWPPLRDKSLKALQYWKTNELSIRSSLEFVAKALLTDISYHAGPQMYTTTLVYKSVLDSIRSINDGRLILGHPQDAFLAGTLLKECPQFVFSGQPFSWVGTSSKSAGLAISKLAKGENNQFAADYVSSVSESRNIPYSSGADFRHGVNSRYFFDALEKVWPELLNSPPFNKTFFKVRVDAQILALSPSRRELHLNPKSLMSSPQNFFAKKLLASWLVALYFARKILYWSGSKFLSKFQLSFSDFNSIDRISSQDELYSAAMRVSGLSLGAQD
jgi:glycosyltransferase involved in cell wall biosynthesis